MIDVDYNEYKETIAQNMKLIIENHDLKEEVERLNNNWNKLRNWIVNNTHNENTEERYLVVDYGTLLGKMSELKGVDKNEKES